mmetsp:Transcript_20055/g.46951  ORF Transcript_20055/g.46951 Transcript_20055/m.46951 type:complete len:232 (+) Transcript_20055:128-823(+)
MSLAVQAACAAAAPSMTMDVGHAAREAIGKPLHGLSAAVSGTPSHSEINWVDFNYPPLLRLIHFNLDELPSTLTGLIRCFNMSFQITTLACIVNLISTAIIVMSTQAPRRWLLQSTLHLLLLPNLALAVFYSGYRGLAEPDTLLASRFRVAQPALAFGYFVLGVVPWGCANGLTQLANMEAYTSGSIFWVVVILCESTLWLGNAALAASNTLRAQRFDAHSGGPCASPNHF